MIFKFPKSDPGATPGVGVRDFDLEIEPLAAAVAAGSDGRLFPTLLAEHHRPIPSVLLGRPRGREVGTIGARSAREGVGHGPTGIGGTLAGAS